tara:strand:- start:1862 stop:2473 length:612 start_codon:yes stop_codon:yes gene_type:complete
MGVLRSFDLSLYEAECFVETGTQKGVGLDYALQHDYKELHSIEINEEYYNFCTQKYKFVDKVKLYHGDSETRIDDVLLAIEKFDSCFFWLDAHLPTDPGSQMKKEYTCSSDKIEFPLEVELQAIKEGRPAKDDIILIDDLRIYLDGPFQYPGHTWPHRAKYPDFFPHKDGIKFIEEMFEDTHSFHKIYNHEGYLLLLPKSRAE